MPLSWRRPKKQVAAYKQFLDGYARQQQTIGRFNWPPNNRLTSLMRQLTLAGVVPGSVTTSLLVALGLLLVALVNSAGLLLAKFTRRSGEIGVRRALGATRRDILRYFQAENLVIAGAGCVLGIVLTAGLNLVLMQHMAMPRLPIWVVAVAVVFVLILGQLAVFVPARRAARVSPATATLSV